MSSAHEQQDTADESVITTKTNEDSKEIYTLLELEHPLNKKFAELARGTFGHSRVVLAMVENICAEINLQKKRTEHLKLAAAFHDIGKIWNPSCFSENQKNTNLHDELPPWISYQLITRHVSDSTTILFNYKFPVEVIRIVSEHHGNSILKVFFDKAQKLDKDIDEADYRYKTNRPSCVESLILMLCDVTEAATKALYIQQSENLDPEMLVNNIFNELHLDGQFDNVEIRLGELAKIQRALTIDIESRYHKREAYPNDKDLMEKKNDEVTRGAK